MDYNVFEEKEDYNFLDYLLDRGLLEPKYTWDNVDEVMPQDIMISAETYYEQYKEYCKENGYYYENLNF